MILSAIHVSKPGELQDSPRQPEKQRSNNETLNDPLNVGQRPVSDQKLSSLIEEINPNVPATDGELKNQSRASFLGGDEERGKLSGESNTLCRKFKVIVYCHHPL